MRRTTHMDHPAPTTGLLDIGEPEPSMDGVRGIRYALTFSVLGFWLPLAAVAFLVVMFAGI